MQQTINDINKVKVGDTAYLRSNTEGFAVKEVDTPDSSQTLRLDIPFISRPTWVFNRFFDHAIREIPDIPEYADDDLDMHFLVSADGKHKAAFQRNHGGDDSPIIFDGSYGDLDELEVTHPDWLPMHEVGLEGEGETEE